MVSVDGVGVSSEKWARRAAITSGEGEKSDILTKCGDLVCLICINGYHLST